MKQYRYPDPSDIVTYKYIEQNELYSGYWKESENIILSVIVNHIKTFHLGNTFIDVGCGEARLIPFFEQHFNRIVGIEPDKKRFDAAKRHLHEHKILSKAKLYQLNFFEFNITEQFDFVLSSHILQHIHSGSVMLMLSKLIKLLKKNGLLAILTCHSVEGRPTFEKSYIRDHVLCTTIIDEQAFNELIQNNDSVLPVCFFPKEEIVRIVQFENKEMELVDFKVFHSVGNLPCPEKENVDMWINSSPSRQEQYGRDMMLLFRKN